MDRRHDRRGRHVRVGQREEIEMVVDEVELIPVLEALGDVQALPHLGVDRRVFLVTARAHGVQPGRQRTLNRTNGLETDARSTDTL